MRCAQPIFLPGVPEDKVGAVSGRAAGHEIASGKFASPQSSAALAANGFGWLACFIGDAVNHALAVYEAFEL